MAPAPAQASPSQLEAQPEAAAAGGGRSSAVDAVAPLGAKGAFSGTGTGVPVTTAGGTTAVQYDNPSRMEFTFLCG